MMDHEPKLGFHPINGINTLTFIIPEIKPKRVLVDGSTRDLVPLSHKPSAVYKQPPATTSNHSHTAPLLSAQPTYTQGVDIGYQQISTTLYHETTHPLLLILYTTPQPTQSCFAISAREQWEPQLISPVPSPLESQHLPSENMHRKLRARRA